MAQIRKLTRLEQSLQRDIDHIRDKILEMADLAENSLQTSLSALTEKKHQLAYSVILRDRYIDELEKEVDRLCQTFLIRQQPAAGPLRFVYAVIKLNNEIERVGDYAESIARQSLSVGSLDVKPFNEKVTDIANLAIPMFCNAIKSFADSDPDLAKATMDLEAKVDEVRYGIHDDLIKLRDDHKIPSEALPPLMIIASRFERVADRACNICEDVLFMCTGEDTKHEGTKTFRVLFVDEKDACRAQMAEGIGKAMGLKRFHFSSAGMEPQPVDPRTVSFMTKKGIDISNQSSKYLNQILHLEDYEVIVSLCQEAEQAFPPPPTKTVRIRWEIGDPSKLNGPEETVIAAYEKTYNYLNEHIKDLMEAILGNDLQKNKMSNNDTSKKEVSNAQ